MTKPQENSWEQQSRKFAIERYERVRKLLAIASAESVRKWCQETLGALEAEFPQLKG